MDKVSKPSHRLRFGEFILDTKRRGLYQDEARVRLTAKPLEALIFLVEHHGHIVEKQALLDAVWKDTFVTEDVLIHAVREIRRALGDDKDNPRFIQTVPRQGYRFVADVTAETAALLPSLADQTSAEQNIARPSAEIQERGRGIPRWFWLITAAVVLIVTAGWIVWRLIPVNEQPRARFQPSNLIQLTSGEFPCGKPAFSPDGKFILYTSSEESTRGFGDLYIRPVAEGIPQRITNKINPSGDLPTFTADGNHVVFSLPRKDAAEWHHHDLWMIPAFGGPPKRYLEDASGAGFSPDGKWVAYTKHLPKADVLWISATANLGEHVEMGDAGYTPRWSPNGEWLAYTTSNPNGGDGSLWICKVASAVDGKPQVDNLRQITKASEQMYGLAWAADNLSIFFASKRNGPSQIYKVSITDASTVALITGVGEYAVPAVSPDGRMLIFQYFHLVNDLVTSVLATPCEAKNVTFDLFHRFPRLSPSAEKLVSVIEQLDESPKLFLTDIRTKVYSQLSDRSAHYPCWIDEENIAFLSPAMDSPNTEVLKINITTRETSLLASFQGEANWLAVHPDNKRMAVVLRLPDGKEKIVLRNLLNQVDQIIQEGSEYEYLRWLPDGSSLSWSKPGVSRNTADISGGIWTIAIGQSEPRLIIKDGFCPVWRDDNNTVYFSGKNGQFGLWKYDRHEERDYKVCDWEKQGISYDIVAGRLVFVQHKNNSQIYSLSLLAK